MELEHWVVRVQGRQQVLVPLDVAVRVQAALHQDARAAKCNRLVYSLTDLVYRVNVGVRLTRPPVKRAEGADDIADVRVVDVAVNDVGDERSVVLTLPDLVGSDPDSGKVARLQ